LNSLLAGSCDETLSSRIYREARAAEARGDLHNGWWIAEDLVNYLFFWDIGKYGEKHCQLANMVELMGGHMPKGHGQKLSGRLRSG